MSTPVPLADHLEKKKKLSWENLAVTHFLLKSFALLLVGGENLGEGERGDDNREKETTKWDVLGGWTLVRGGR